MLQTGDIIYHEIYGYYGIMINLWKNWDNKYCNVYWFNIDKIQERVLTSDCTKVS